MRKKIPRFGEGTLIGNFLELRKSPLDFFLKLNHFSDKIASFKILNHRIIFLNEPDLIEQVLINQAKNFTQSYDIGRTVPFLGIGPSAVASPERENQSRADRHAFTPQHLEKYAETILEITDQTMNNWFAGPVNIHEYLCNLTLKILNRILFGIEHYNQSIQIGALMNILLSGKQISHPFTELKEKLPLPTTLRSRVTKRKIEAVIDEIIKARMQDESSMNDKHDLLSALLRFKGAEGNPFFGTSYSRDQCITLFAEGYETAANTLAWGAYLLAKNPEVLKKVRQEVENILKTTEHSIQALSELKYTRAVLAEVLRLYPPVWGISRKALSDCQLQGYKIRKGNSVVMLPYLMHRSPQYWKDPQDFKPERFGRVNTDRPKFSYFPFGGGVHPCFGDSFTLSHGTLILGLLANKFDIAAVPEHEAEIDAAATLRPKNGIKVKLMRRRVIALSKIGA